MKRKLFIILFLILFIFVSLYSADRFPRPEFKTNYEIPTLTTPQPRFNFYDYLDTGMLFLSLGLATWFALKNRNRTGLLLCAVFSVLYFGFWRRGCVCAVGSLQNVTLAIFNAAYVIPVTVILFFLLPLVFTLFFGRTFCSGICPLGALQELVAVKPIRLPGWLNKGLGTVPIIYLALAILYAATGTDFIICRFDPLVGFFRFGATTEMFIFGGIILLVGVFIARPYCRFLCPYGVILGWLSRLSGNHLTITPDECINCRLCEKSCPVGAISIPDPGGRGEKRKIGRRRLILLLIIMPLVAIGMGWGLSALTPVLSRLHPDVATAIQIKLENIFQTDVTTLESDTFRATGELVNDLYIRAEIIKSRFRTGGWLTGILLGIVLSLRLIGLSVRRKKTGYEPDKAACVSCGRCFASCPRHHKLKKMKKTALKT